MTSTIARVHSFVTRSVEFDRALSCDPNVGDRRRAARRGAAWLVLAHRATRTIAPRQDINQVHSMRVSLQTFHYNQETRLCESSTVWWRWPASPWRPHAPTAVGRAAA